MNTGLTSQASSTLVSAFTDTIRESMRSGHSHEDRNMMARNLFTYLEQTPFSTSPAILPLRFRRHRRTLLGVGLVPSRKIARISCFGRWILSMSNLLNTSWNCEGYEGYYTIAWLQGQTAEADHAPIGFLALRYKKSDVRR